MTRRKLLMFAMLFSEIDSINPNSRRRLQTLSPSTISPGSTNVPSATITGLATRAPSASPSATITGLATRAPSASPSATITGLATRAPSASPSATITGLATRAPSASPSVGGNIPATESPTTSPTNLPTFNPTVGSTIGVTTNNPSAATTTNSPTLNPTETPTNSSPLTPSPVLTTSPPTLNPTPTITTLNPVITLNPTSTITTLNPVITLNPTPTITTLNPVITLNPTPTITTLNPVITLNPTPTIITLNPTTISPTPGLQTPAPTSSQPMSLQPTPLSSPPVPSPTIPPFFLSSDSEDQAPDDQNNNIQLGRDESRVSQTDPIEHIQHGATTGGLIENEPTEFPSVVPTILMIPTSDPTGPVTPDLIVEDDTFHPSVAPQLASKSAAVEPKSGVRNSPPMPTFTPAIGHALGLIIDVDVAWTNPPTQAPSEMTGSPITQIPTTESPVVELSLRSQQYAPSNIDNEQSQTRQDGIYISSAPVETQVTDSLDGLPAFDGNTAVQSSQMGTGKKTKKLKKHRKAHHKTDEEKQSGGRKKKRDETTESSTTNENDCMVVQHGNKWKRVCKSNESVRHSSNNIAPVIPPVGAPNSYAPILYTFAPSPIETDAWVENRNYGRASSPTAQSPTYYPSTAPVFHPQVGVNDHSPATTRHYDGDANEYDVGSPSSSYSALSAPEPSVTLSPTRYWEYSVPVTSSVRGSSLSGRISSGESEENEGGIPHEHLNTDGIRIKPSKKVGVGNPQISFPRKRKRRIDDTKRKSGGHPSKVETHKLSKDEEIEGR